MDKVYFISEEKKLEETTKKLLGNYYFPKDRILIKIHFGEPGNKAAFTCEDVEPIIKGLSKEVTFFDSPVAYSSPRGKVGSYRKVALKKGFARLGKVLISNRGKKVKTKDMSVEVCSALIKARNILVISHIKGHIASGFGGAVKNLGMGGVSRESKIQEHALSKPRRGDGCLGCGICVKLCPVGAIKIVNGKAEVNIEECAGCSICQVKCPNQVLSPKKANFDDLLAQAGSAVINNFQGKVFYINFLKRIVRYCDCSSFAGERIAKNVGVLFSSNPIAIDKASIDLIKESEGEEIFEKNLHKNPLTHIKFASKYSGWPMEYELVRI